jgi:hypothetical protein
MLLGLALLRGTVRFCVNSAPARSSMALDGVFSEAHAGALEFHPAPGPSDAEVAEVLATVRHRVRRLLVRRGLEPGDDATRPADRLAEESPVLAGLVSASVQGRVALGPRAGAREVGGAGGLRPGGRSLLDGSVGADGSPTASSRWSPASSRLPELD